MDLTRLTAGRDVPHDVNVVIEIPLRGDPVKYEMDKVTGAMCVDRFINTAMHYPCNYGYIPHTLAEDGDPADVLVLAPAPLITGSVIRCRPIGLLTMTDEKGPDSKVLAVPADDLCLLYQAVREAHELPPLVLQQIQHFFEHYKDLEPGKWVKVQGWGTAAAAKAEVLDAAARYARAPVKPAF